MTAADIIKAYAEAAARYAAMGRSDLDSVLEARSGDDMQTVAHSMTCAMVNQRIAAREAASARAMLFDLIA